MNTNIIKFLIQIKNASALNKEIVVVPYRKYFLSIISLLYKEGIILSFKRIKVLNSADFNLKIIIKQSYNKDFFKKFKLVSKPSRTLYLNYKSICRLVLKKTDYFFSTNVGLLTALDCKKHRVGGTLLFTC
jgi:ribosomal protein S8